MSLGGQTGDYIMLHHLSESGRSESSYPEITDKDLDGHNKD